MNYARHLPADLIIVIINQRSLIINKVRSALIRYSFDGQL